MLKRLTLALALLAAGAGAATLLGIGAAGAAQAPTSQNVQEQNVDAQGNIKVHEQGTPSVKIVATANTVKVDASGGPLPTVATDNPAFHPVVTSAQFETPVGEQNGGAVVYTVPSGSELVIEQFSVASDQKLADAGLRFPGTEPGPESEGNFPLATEIDGFGGSFGDMLTHIYVAPGIQVFCEVSRIDDSGIGSSRCSFSGYLVALK